MNLSQSFSLSLLDLHLTFKVDIISTVAMFVRNIYVKCVPQRLRFVFETYFTVLNGFKSVTYKETLKIFQWFWQNIYNSTYIQWHTYQLSEFGIRKSVEISSHTVVPSIFKNNKNKLFLISPFTTNIKTENLLWVVSGILCVCLLKEEICRTKRLYWEILQASSLVKTWYQ